MESRVLLVLLASLFVPSLSKDGLSTRANSSITVMGVVYCDVCSNNTFSKHSYFLPGAEVHIDCKFKADSLSTSGQIAFSVNRTTDKYGIYKLEIPSAEGVQCAEGLAVQSFCHASLIRSSSSACSNPGLKTTSDHIAIKSKEANLCFYSLNTLTYRPSSRDTNLCGEFKDVGLPNSYNDSKFFLPYFPPFGFPWPPIPQLPPFTFFPFPPLPPFPYIPFPPLAFSNQPPPPLPFPFPPLSPLPPLPQFPPLPPSPPMPFTLPPPSLPFPFPPFPPLPSLPPLPPLPSLPPLPPLPPLPTLFPQSPPPPVFSLSDPRTLNPPFPSNQHQDQHHP